MKTFIELIILIAIIFGLIFMVSFNFLDQENFINQEFRPLFIQSSFTRKVFALKHPGDNRYEYANPENDQILIEVDYAANAVPNPKITEWLKNMTQETFGKSAVVIVAQKPEIASQNQFTNDELDNLTKNTKSLEPGQNQAYLHIVYLPQSKSTPTNSGLAYTLEDIYIFKSTIDGLTNKVHIQERVEESTLKHEWGHILGLDHLDELDCIMSETVEVYENRNFQGSNIPLEYCPETLFQLDKMTRR